MKFEKQKRKLYFTILTFRNTAQKIVHLDKELDVDILKNKKIMVIEDVKTKAKIKFNTHDLLYIEVTETEE